MFIILIIFITLRPFICSPAFPGDNFNYSIWLTSFLICWALIKGVAPGHNDHVRKTILLFLLSIMASFMTSVNKLYSTFAISQYITAILLFTICQSLSRQERNKAIIALITAGICVSALAIHQFFLGFQIVADYLTSARIYDPIASAFIEQKRVFEPFITPGALSSYLIMIIPLTLTLRKRILFAAPLLFALGLTQSLGAALSLLAAALIYMHLRSKPIQNRQISISLILLITAILAIFIVRSNSSYSVFQPTCSLRMRLSYWLESFTLLQQNLLTGQGPGNFNLPASRYAHNTLVQIITELGVLGLLAFLITISSITLTALKNIRLTKDKLSICLFCSATAFFIHNLGDFSIFLPETGMIWCVIMGLLLNTNKQSDTNSNSC